MEHDTDSDYGSDFTPDEEEILSSLLQQAPITPTEDSGLILRDLEDDEGPRHARMPRMYERQRGQSIHPSTLTASQSAHIAVEIGDNSNLSTNGESSEIGARTVTN